MNGKRGQTVHGYDIRIKRDGDTWERDVRFAWGVGDGLPTEWEAVKADKSVVRAVIHRNTERRKPSQHRQILDEYTREDE
jgi:hypothetical protein